MMNEREIQAKKKADCKKFGFFGSQMEGRDYKDLSSMNQARRKHFDIGGAKS